MRKNVSVCSVDMSATGRNIRTYRRKQGLSVAEIAEFFWVSENSVYKWERGQSLPSLDNLYSLTALFRVPMDRLLVWSTACAADS